MLVSRLSRSTAVNGMRLLSHYRHLRLDPVGTDTDRLASNLDIDETEREAIRAEGLDPDDPAVVTAIDWVR
jgi:hypothetical protein